MAHFNFTTISINETRSFHPPSYPNFRRTKSFVTNMFTRPNYIPNKIIDKSYIRIFDTTLRDGEQAPGATMTSQQKLDIAYSLANMGVDVIDAGFPNASTAEFKAVSRIALEVGNKEVDESGFLPVISATVRCVKEDVELAWDAVKAAKYPRANIFIGTSKIHMEHKLRKNEEDIIICVRQVLSFAKSLGFRDIQFVPEDAGRSERRFIYELFEEAIKAGATTIDIADTVGYRLPYEWAKLFEDVTRNVPGIENVVLATHCHDDLGLASANTLAAAFAGARQLDVTINGIGERAGNASMEEVEEYSGLHTQHHKAIVGANAFTHASGVHQDGVLKNRGTYEIMAPEDVGRSRSSGGIVLGKLSGRKAFQRRLEELGYRLDVKTFDEVFSQFKSLAEKKKSLSNKDVAMILQKENIVPSSM